MVKFKLTSGLGKSLALHVIMLVVIFTSIGFAAKPVLDVNLQKDVHPEQQIVKAGVIDKRAVDEAYQRQLLVERQRLQKLAEEKQMAAQAKQEAEKLKQEAAAAQKALEVAKAQKAQAEAESKKLKVAQDKVKQDLAKQQAAAQQALAKQQELAKKEEAMRKASAIKAEQDKLRAQRDSIIMNEVQRYAAEFTQAIEENRILSSVFNGDLCCKIRIQLLPNGQLLSASVAESSGNPQYDEFSKNAVYKAAPFDMPTDKEVCDKLRDIVLSFRNGEQDVS